MYVILEEIIGIYSDKMLCHGLFVEREKAIVERNFLEWKARDTEIHYVIVDVGEVRDAGIEGVSWTNLRLENAPLNTKLDLEKDLKDNNHVHASITAEKMEQQRRREEQVERERALKNSIAETRESLRPVVITTYREVEELLATDKQTQLRLHQEVINARKQLKKGNVSVERFRELEDQERAISREVGKKKATMTRISNKYVTDFRKRLLDRGHDVLFVDRRDHTPQSSPFELTVRTKDYRSYDA